MGFEYGHRNQEVRHRDLGQVHRREDFAVVARHLAKRHVVQVDKLDAQSLGKFRITESLENFVGLHMLIAAPFTYNDRRIAALADIFNDRLDAARIGRDRRRRRVDQVRLDQHVGLSRKNFGSGDSVQRLRDGDRVGFELDFGDGIDEDTPY